jgi:hypothetical protein
MNPAGSNVPASNCARVLRYRSKPANTSNTPAPIVKDPSHTEIPAVRTGCPCKAVNCRMAMANRPIANPNTTIAAPVRTHARNVLSFARWSRARLGLLSVTCSPTPGAPLLARSGREKACPERGRRVGGSLFHSFPDHTPRARKILDQLLRRAMPLLQILRIVVCD